jgi:hypothetical protein
MHTGKKLITDNVLRIWGIKCTISWHVMLCTPAEFHQHFRVTYILASIHKAEERVILVAGKRQAANHHTPIQVGFPG